MSQDVPLPLTDLSDGDLLRLFVKSRDESAFRVVVDRHGPLVLGVCRRNSHSVEDADDAFQATFLVLAQSAGKIRRQRSLAAWLYGVARRVCLRMRRERAGRPTSPLMEAVVTYNDPLDELLARHDGMAADEELSALPEKLRAPLVLRYLAGKSNDAVAKELGISVAALEGRLKRGKHQLRLRLIRRGVTLAVLVAALKATRVPAGGVPELLIENTTGLCCGPTLSNLPTPTTETSVVNHLALEEIKAMNALLIPKALAPLAIAGIATLALGVHLAMSQPPAGADDDAFALDAAAITTDPAEATSVVVPALFAAEAPAKADPFGDAAETGASPKNNDPFGSSSQVDPFDKKARSRVATASAPEKPAGAASIDLKPRSEIEKQVEAALTEPAPLGVDFREAPLEEVIDYLQTEFGIPMVLDGSSLDEMGIASDEPVTINLPNGVMLESILRHLLRPLELTFIVRDEMLLITSQDTAESTLDVRVYPIEDLGAIAMKEMLLKTVAPATWQADGQGEGNIDDTIPGSLVIRQTYAVHQEIAAVLKQIRQSQQPASTPTANSSPAAPKAASPAKPKKAASADALPEPQIALQRAQLQQRLAELEDEIRRKEDALNSLPKDTGSTMLPENALRNQARHRADRQAASGDSCGAEKENWR